MGFIRWLLELPLAIASFIAFKLVKFVIGGLYSVYLGLNRRLASEWRLLSADTLASPLSLPVLMTKGPRWNTHAIIGTVGPFTVQRELALDVGAIARSARSWTAAIYSYPGYRTVDNLGSLNTAAVASSGELSEQWQAVTLPPGRYSIGLRYYHPSDAPTLPPVRVDGAAAIPAQAIPPDVNGFYHDLAQKTSGFYRFLHSYVFTMLKLRRWLPAAFVRREYLPVGAPETHFFYGAMEQGDRLFLQLAPALVQHFDVYLTVYNRASLPRFWDEIQTETYHSKTLLEDGFYLFRIRPKSPDHTEFSATWLNITTEQT